METLKFLIATRLKQAKAAEPNNGFTLIEILVALLIAFFVITPLLGLAVGLLNTDRQENAKATSEQEVQAAADFIARDLQQAVFIYPPNPGLTNNNSTTVTTSGIKDQIPPIAGEIGGCTKSNCIPILAFWKRHRVSDAVAVDSGQADDKGMNPGTNCKETTDKSKCDDTFVYALITYYLIKGGSDPTWSSAARIGRFEITDGVKYLSGFEIKDSKRSKKTRNTGFQLFDLGKSAPTLAAKMNSWTRVKSSDYSASKDANGVTSAPQMQILVDYINRTSVTASVLLPNCPAGAGWSQTPSTAPPNTPAPAIGFSVCVNTEQNIARVFLQGDALARIRPSVPEYTEEQLEKASAYFPTATAEVRGVGGLRE